MPRKQKFGSIGEAITDSVVDKIVTVVMIIVAAAVFLAYLPKIINFIINWVTDQIPKITNWVLNIGIDLLNMLIEKLPGIIGDAMKKALSGIGLSDPRLKTNIIQLSPGGDGTGLGKCDLPIYRWTWKKNNPYGLSGQDVGVLSTDAKKCNPKSVRKDELGYEKINMNMIN
jgi:hypothetical protein